VAAYAGRRNGDAAGAVCSMAVLATAANGGVQHVGLVLMTCGAGFVQLRAGVWLMAALAFPMPERSARRFRGMALVTGGRWLGSMGIGAVAGRAFLVAFPYRSGLAGSR
jgi:hypothetical protein